MEANNSQRIRYRKGTSVILSFFALLLLLPPDVLSQETCAFGEKDGTCLSEDQAGKENQRDKWLKPMTYDFGHGEETFGAYVLPDVSSFYQKSDGTHKKSSPRFSGIAGKFINMGPERMILMWDPGNGEAASQIADCPPFTAVGTATFPGHKFFFAVPPARGEESMRYRFNVVADDNLYVYDPFLSSEQNPSLSLDDLRPDQFDKYMTLKRTLHFSAAYKEFTGRDWLSRFPRDPPKHFMWPAEYFEQTHEVETKETHFTSLPPDSMLSRINPFGESLEKRDELKPYRNAEPTLNLTVTVLSCAPRAFEIKNFLSDVEVEHVLKLATGLTLSTSTVSGGEDGRADSRTRTSKNTWVYRQHSPIVDAIYRRAADLLRIDEALLRRRKDDEYPDFPFPEQVDKKSIAEPLQLVHYNVGQQYTAHHDFGYPKTDSKTQGTRFATLLLYLNEGMEGGETTFPRFLNGHTKDALKVVPEIGKAVLFYSYLPDGNLDDLSQHSASPVKKGEKWLMNLWIWDPVYD